ncbi:hypothetical protein ACFYYS_06305 [Streptomyces sp. NPDC002120]|uniref:hypothetical protein n=1 Tax=Streptomyces sp. NPDC002120 TaxID=3364631 RepID=UPI0036BAFE4A
MREPLTTLADLFDDPEQDTEAAWAVANGFGFFEDDTDTFMKTRKGRVQVDYL